MHYAGFTVAACQKPEGFTCAQVREDEKHNQSSSSLWDTAAHCRFLCINGHQQLLAMTEQWGLGVLEGKKLKP